MAALRLDKTNSISEPLVRFWKFQMQDTLEFNFLSILWYHTKPYHTFEIFSKDFVWPIWLSLPGVLSTGMKYLLLQSTGARTVVFIHLKDVPNCYTLASISLSCHSGCLRSLWAWRGLAWNNETWRGLHGVNKIVYCLSVRHRISSSILFCPSHYSYFLSPNSYLADSRLTSSAK